MEWFHPDQHHEFHLSQVLAKERCKKKPHQTLYKFLILSLYLLVLDYFLVSTKKVFFPPIQSQNQRHGPWVPGPLFPLKAG